MSNPPNASSPPKVQNFPNCLNKNEARMVCLSPKCQTYPFFCSICEDSSCEIPHQHDDKLISVSYKELNKRILRPRKPMSALEEAMGSYRTVLAKLQEDVNEFIRKELLQLDAIEKKTQVVPEDDSSLIQKLRNMQFEGLTGAVLDKLWTNCAEDPAQLQAQEETAEFIKIKEEEVQGISQHFAHLNTIDHDSQSLSAPPPSPSTSLSPPPLPASSAK